MLNEVKDHDVDLSFDFGNFEDYTLESIYSLPNILVQSGRIFVTEPFVSMVHSFGVSIFTLRFVEAMLDYNEKIKPMNKILLFVKNVYYGSVVFRRQVDFTLSITGYETPLIGEIDYKKEDHIDLYPREKLMIDYQNGNLTDFNAKILLKAKRTQNDLSPIEFSLNSCLIDQDLSKEISQLNVTISSKDLEELFNCWKEHMKQYN
ncbi:unnamed protein product [Brachionus calyciflorus]|uniref:Uncharacterized protein n=1 Tax=Brachionus calyciflorus TaxID=104777 RepID=A0A813R9V9_9BILA|nr:unnamed protein product [Brachionus calyciflorus]